MLKLFWNVCVFPYISLTTRIHFSHILGIVWISASPKIFEKSITLECLFFPILSPYYGNSLFPYFGNCMGFCFTQNISETHKFEMFVFSHAFFILCKSTFPIFLELHGFLLQIKNLRNPYLWKCLCFPINFPYYGNSLFPYFGNCMD